MTTHILDCLRPVLDALGLSEDKKRLDGSSSRSHALLKRRRNRRCLPLVQHMGHTNERSRGDSRLQDWPDADLAGDA